MTILIAYEARKQSKSLISEGRYIRLLFYTSTSRNRNDKLCSGKTTRCCSISPLRHALSCPPFLFILLFATASSPAVAPLPPPVPTAPPWPPSPLPPPSSRSASGTASSTPARAAGSSRRCGSWPCGSAPTILRPMMGRRSPRRWRRWRRRPGGRQWTASSSISSIAGSSSPPSSALLRRRKTSLVCFFFRTFFSILARF